MVDPDRLTVITEAMVRGVFPGSAGISGTGPNDAYDAPKLGIRAQNQPRANVAVSTLAGTTVSMVVVVHE